MERDLIPILCITGSDGTGGSGIQADIKTCGVLGGYALSVVTAVTVQDTIGIRSSHPMSADVIGMQLQSIVQDILPQAVKVGMLTEVEAVHQVSKQLQKLTHVVLDCAFITSRGERIAGTDVIESVCRYIMPLCDIVIMKLSEAELLLNQQISNREQMQKAADSLLEVYGMKAIILRGTYQVGKVKHDLLVVRGEYPQSQYFTLPDRTGSNTHGLAGTLSASIATFLAQRHSLSMAVRNAYAYLQTLTVYSVHSSLGHQTSLIGHLSSLDSKHEASGGISPRQQELYNQLMQLLANHCHQQHDVRFYADQLHITPRYLSQITMSVARKNTKAIIVDALVSEASNLLSTTSRSIQEVAFELGFATQEQLTKLFRKAKGISPSAFRRKG